MMLGGCATFRTQHEFLSTMNGGEPAEVGATLIGVNGHCFEVSLPCYNSYTVDIYGEIHAGRAANIAMIVQKIARLIPIKLASIKLWTKVGGITFTRYSKLLVSNPETIATEFALLFEEVVNAR